jgi:membrane protein required for beta-lactamase induction
MNLGPQIVFELLMIAASRFASWLIWAALYHESIEIRRASLLSLLLIVLSVALALGIVDLACYPSP